MMAEEQYEKLVNTSHQPKSLVEFFRRSPLVGIELDMSRAVDDKERDIDL